MFQRIRLAANITKLKTITCQPGAIRLGMAEEAFCCRSNGEGETYQELLRRRVSCPDCGAEMTAGSLTDHRWRIHGNDPEIEWDMLPVIQHKHLP